MADNRFLPASLGDWLSLPARLAMGGDTVTIETLVRDIRFALFWYALVPALGVLAVWRWRKAVAFCRATPRTTFLYAFFITAYVVWETTTGIHRYALTLDLLVGFLLALPLLIVPYRWACIGAGVMAALHIDSMPPHYGTTSAWLTTNLQRRVRPRSLPKMRWYSSPGSLCSIRRKAISSTTSDPTVDL